MKKPKYYCSQLDEYTRHYGEMKRLAILVDVSLTTMSLWCSGKRRVPASRCMSITRATGGYVQPRHMRPDLDWST